VELVSFQVESSHLDVADFDAFLVGSRIERTLDFQTGSGRRGADQFDDGEAIGERATPPVLGDVTEQAVLDPRLRGDKPCSIWTSRADSGGRGS